MIFRRNPIGGAVHAFADLTGVSICGYGSLNYEKARGPATCAHCVRKMEKLIAAYDREPRLIRIYR